MKNADPSVPISSLFFDDAGPHVIRAGFPSKKAAILKPTPARGQELRALLNTSISQLGGVSGEIRRRTPPVTPVVPLVDIQSLLYSGRAALERALDIRNQILSSGTAGSPGEIEELLDLVALAATE